MKLINSINFIKFIIILLILIRIYYPIISYKFIYYLFNCQLEMLQKYTIYLILLNLIEINNKLIILMIFNKEFVTIIKK